MSPQRYAPKLPPAQEEFPTGSALAASLARRLPAGQLFGLIQVLHPEGTAILSAVRHRLEVFAEQVEPLGDSFLAVALSGKAMVSALSQALLEPVYAQGMERRLLAHAGMVYVERCGGDPFAHAVKLLKAAIIDGRALVFEEVGEAQPASLSDPSDWELSLHLLTALDNGELRPYYQPQVDATGKVVSFESLIRWNSPVWGTLPPSRFLPLIEQTRNMGRLTAMTLKEAVTLSREVGVPVAVNMSPIQILAPNFLPSVDYVLHTYHREGATLEIEVTENCMIESMQLLQETVRHLHRAGVRVSIDDFGAGYSNLKLLPDAHADCLKLDRAMIENIVTSQRSRVVCRALASLARELGMTALVEGVETVEQLTVLQEIGFEVFQGYYFDPALPREQALEVVRTGYQHKLLAS